MSQRVLCLIDQDDFNLGAFAIFTNHGNCFQASATEVVNAQIVANPEKPGRKTVGWVITFQGRPGTYEGLLGQFLGQLDITDKLRKKRRQPSLIPANQLGKGIFIPRQGRRHQAFVFLPVVRRNHKNELIQASGRDRQRAPGSGPATRLQSPGSKGTVTVPLFPGRRLEIREIFLGLGRLG